MNVSNRQYNICKDDYKNQTDKITAGQMNIYLTDKIKAGQMNVSNRQNNSRTDEYIRQTR